jgi:DoxX-like family
VGIFVETVIRAPIDKLWLHTQDPALHQRWDVRFTRIEYLPKDDDDEPQRFRYVRTLLPGLAVTGLGQTVADRSLPDGARASSIRFGSADWWSLIREGSGYWRYAMTPEGIRFATWYDYRSRWGRLGTVVDRFLFRPLIGWATAWSFDRLRIWLERDIPPTTTLRAAMIHAGARIGLAAVFAFHGLVPKLLSPDPDELLMLKNAGVPAGSVESALLAMGILELVLAAVLLVFWHRRWPTFVCLGFAAAATLGVALGSPDYLRSAFNPAILNVAVAALAITDLLALPDAPDAGRCRRRPREAAR